MTTPKAKTLYELAEERQAELFLQADARRRTSAAEPNIRVKRVPRAPTTEPEDEALGPLSLAFFYGLTLSMLHFTLDVLVHHQYKREIEWMAIFYRTVTSFPSMCALLFRRLFMAEKRPLADTQQSSGSWFSFFTRQNDRICSRRRCFSLACRSGLDAG